MAELSYSPLFQQGIIWVAEYNDGTIFREWDDDGKSHAFISIDKSKLRKFHLVSADFDYYFDCQTGVFTVDGRQYVFPLSGLNLNYAEGLIHFKDATTEFVPASIKTSEYDGFEINGYEIGWKVTHNDIKSQVILYVPSRKSFPKVFNASMTFLDDQKTVSWSLQI